MQPKKGKTSEHCTRRAGDDYQAGLRRVTCVEQCAVGYQPLQGAGLEDRQGRPVWHQVRCTGSRDQDHASEKEEARVDREAESGACQEFVLSRDISRIRIRGQAGGGFLQQAKRIKDSRERITEKRSKYEKRE